MKLTIRCFCMLALGVLLSSAAAAPPTSSTQTVILIPELHCAGCAKKVSTRLSAVTGVAAVKTDMKAKQLIVTPQAQALVSPRALWEAVEKAGEKPTKLEGPSGSFTSKPQS